MKARFPSLEIVPGRVFRGLVAVGLCLAGLVAVLVVGGYVERAWYYPWRSSQVLRRLNVQTQSLDEQLQIINKARGLNPHNFDALFWYARKLVEKKCYGEAVYAWGDVRKHDRCPNGVLETSFADQGMCLLFANRSAEAIVYLQETIRRRPDHITARGFLAAAYVELGLSDRVEEELVKLANLKSGWQQEFEACPEYQEEHEVVLAKLKPYLKEAGESCTAGQAPPCE